jgi:hypothetical protein
MDAMETQIVETETRVAKEVMELIRREVRVSLAGERLLDRQGVCDRLGIHYRTFPDMRAMFIARGLVEVKLGRARKYIASSVDRLIRNLQED